MISFILLLRYCCEDTKAQSFVCFEQIKQIIFTDD